MNTKNKKPDAKSNLVFTKTIQSWDEAIPLGNGRCGALIWGEPEHFRFSLDRGDIWDTTPYEGFSGEKFSYAEMLRLVKEGNVEEIRRIFCKPYFMALPSKLPAGKLLFDFGCRCNVHSTLNLQRAEAEVKLGDAFCIRSFLHARENVGMIQINRPLSAFSFRIENPAYSVEGEQVEKEEFACINTASLKQLVYPAPKAGKEGELRYFTQKISEDFSYGVFAMAREKGENTEIAYTVAVSNDGQGWEKKAAECLEQALQQGYDALLESHMEWWEDYWDRSSVSLPDSLFEKNWYLTQYFLASCSRKGCYPMPLQGVWTADNGALPPWKGDYHLDLNVQMSYYSYPKANHREEGEALLDYLWDMAECGRKFARSFYHSKGLCMPSVMTLDGKPLGGWAMYAFSPTNQIWNSQLFERHYRFTGDRQFLRERAYPYMAETAEFIQGILEERDGKYYLPISSSPEIHDDRLEAFVTPNSNYDLALMRYLFGTLAELAAELENGEEEKWKEFLKQLPELSVSEEGVLEISPDEKLCESHRHHSHAMAIHPLRLMPYEGEENRRMIDATILDLERLGTGAWVGFSFTWMAELYAVQKNGNGAAYQLETFWRNHCSQNGFHLNGDYKKRGTSASHSRPFTLEANFCAADAVQEMLLQSENNVLELFPAVPEEWVEEKIAFTDFCAEKGLLVSAVMEQGRVVSLTLKTKYSGNIYIRKSEGLREILNEMKEAKEAGDDRAELPLEAGREYCFCLKEKIGDET